MNMVTQRKLKKINEFLVITARNKYPGTNYIKEKIYKAQKIVNFPFVKKRDEREN